MAVQAWLQEQAPDFIKEVHKQFYLHIPERLWEIKNKKGDVISKVEPGEWRTQKVAVGEHVPPEAECLSDLMESFCNTYHPKRFNGDRKLIAIMAAHYRFAYIHPFLDGNGRVGRLITDAALKAAGLESYGVWCLSRGLANKNGNYKKYLSVADQIRQGDYDGRGQLTEKGLLAFCEYMLETAIDQVDYVGNLLNLSNLKKRMDGYIQARNDFRVTWMDKEIKPVASLILHAAFIYGELERSQALELCGMPERMARPLLSQLKEEGLLSEANNKSPLRWKIPEHAEPWYFPDLAPHI